jgi:two-component system, cell cycle sensor histidine kinase and response regulator CckA
MAIVSPEGRFLRVNRALCELVGYQEEELLAATFQHVTHPEDLSADLAQVRQLLADEIPSYQMEKRYVRKTGRVVWALLSVSLVRDKHKKPLYFVSQIQNITPRKLAEEALQLAENQYRSIVDNALVGIFQSSVEGKYLIGNPSMARMLGYDSPAELTTGVADIAAQLYVNPERRRELAAQLQEKAEVRDFECELYRRDGGKIWVSVTVRGVFKNGILCGLEGTTVDITERKLLEEKLRQSARMEAIGRLAGGVAHDFNNLIGVMVGYSSLMREQLPPGSPLLSFVDQICRAGERGASLSRQLLAFSRKQVTQPAVFDVNDVLSEMRPMLSRVIGEDIDLHLLREATPSLIRADPAQFEQIVMNLAANARDAMPHGGVLTIRTFHSIKAPAPEDTNQASAKNNGYMVMNVSDTGFGMSLEVQSHIFEPFFTTKGGKGTGLGLATVYAIVKQCGGQMTVFSEPGRGTEFQIYLPLAEKCEKAAERVEHEVLSRSGSETILVVEDDEAMRSLTHICLQRCGYRVLSMSNGTAAARAAERYDGVIHLLLTDVVMPGINGRELAETLTALRPGLRVLYMSGYTADVVGKCGVIEQGTRLMEKPFTIETLSRNVRRALDENVDEKGKLVEKTEAAHEALAP